MDMKNPGDAPATKSDFKAFQDELRLSFKDVRDDITGVQGRLTSLESRLTSVQGGLTSVQDGLTGVWAELRATRRNLALEIVRTRVHAEKQTEILRDEMRARNSEITEHIDGFIFQIDQIESRPS